jgi:hypothetical protein
MKDKEYKRPLPRTEQSRQYDETLVIVKTQIDIIVNSNNSIHSWLNEVQAYLNRARMRAVESGYNPLREYYDD